MAYIAGGDTDDTKLNYKPAISGILILLVIVMEPNETARGICFTFALGFYSWNKCT